METTSNHLPFGNSRRYQRHQPESTALYPIFEQDLSSLRDELCQRETILPHFVLNEFDEYLRSYRTSAANLFAAWEDPEFDSAEPAYYYGRELEGPTCRWSQRQCVAKGVRSDEKCTTPEGFEECCCADHRPQAQIQK